jgi:hypothetical protein
MSWMTNIFNLLDLRQSKLLLWFLAESQTRYVESDGVRFEWENGFAVISGPRFETVVVPFRLIMSDAFRSELRSEVSRAIIQPDQSPFRKEATHAG